MDASVTMRNPALILQSGRARSNFIANLVMYLLLAIFGTFFLFPLVWMILSSFKLGPDIASRPLSFDLSSMSLESYTALLRNVPLLTGFKNTLIVVVFKGGINLFFCP